MKLETRRSRQVHLDHGRSDAGGPQWRHVAHFGRRQAGELHHGLAGQYWTSVQKITKILSFGLTSSAKYDRFFRWYSLRYLILFGNQCAEVRAIQVSRLWYVIVHRFFGSPEVKQNIISATGFLYISCEKKQEVAKSILRDRCTRLSKHCTFRSVSSRRSSP